MQKVRRNIKSIDTKRRQATYSVLRRHPRLARLYLSLRSLQKKVVAWWWHNDRRYGTSWRLASMAAVVLVVMAAVIPTVDQLLTARAYALSGDTRKLIGTNDDRLTKQLKYDATTATYQFNRAAVKSSDDNPFSNLQAQVGTASGDEGSKSLYALDVPTDTKKGVTYHDINSGLSFTMKPNFGARNGRNIDGHLVFPLQNGNQAVYTLKNNGLKEDIVVPRVTTDTLTFDYTLDLPKTLAVKTLPDGSGGIGIYSADPTLFANIQYGSESDRANVEKARENGEKTYLVFGLPAPVTKNIAGQQIGKSRFVLDGDTLKVVATGLEGVKGPITVDPSVVVTSTSDFQTSGNDEGMISFATSGQISRGSLTGGSSGGWANAANSFSTARYGHGTVAYNGYLYVMGGQNSSNTSLNNIQYAAVNSNGNTGVWQSNTVNLPVAMSRFGVVAYNGYMYVVGGNTTGVGAISGVYYAPINSDGSIGNWTATTSLAVTRQSTQATVYNGYLYIAGGLTTGATQSNEVLYAPINANGTIGSWITSPNSFANARYGLAVQAYNGYLYVVGGRGGGTFYNDVQYAKLVSDGSVGTFRTTTSFNGPRTYMGVMVYNGYLYVTAGHKTGNIDLADTQYAQINADGSVGTWQATTSLTSARHAFGSVAYNGYLYVLGGTTFTPSYLSDTQYAKIDPAGTTTPWTTTTETPNTTGYPKTTINAAVVAYNGYIYQIGGRTQDAANDFDSKVIYAPINSDGSIGTWNLTSPLAAASGSAGVVLYNNNIYILGGYAPGSVALATTQYASIKPDGTLSAWATTTNLPAAIANQPAAAYNGYVYMLGLGAGPATRVQYAPINANGTLGSWTNSANSIQTGRVFGQMAASGGYLYVVAGSYGATMFASVEYAPINADGSVGNFTSTASLSIGRNRFGLEMYKGYLYAIGGQIDSGGTETASVEYAKLLPTGGLDAWQQNTALPATVKNSGTAIYNGYMYSISGNVATVRSRTAYYTTINNGGNGATSTWTTGSSTFSNGRTRSAVVAYNGYIYTIGGKNASSFFNDVQYARLTSDGTVTGSWAPTTSMSSFTSGRAGMSAFATNGYLYVLGGQDAAGGNSDVHYAAINNDGTLGVWTTTSSLTDTRFDASVVQYGSYAYLFGGVGTACGPYCRAVQYAPINSNGTLGAWATTSAFAIGRYGTAAAMYGGYAYVIGGTTSTGVANDVQYARVNPNGSLGTWATNGNSLMNPRTYAQAVAYNGAMYLVGGYDGTSAQQDVQVSPINIGGSLVKWNVTTSLGNARYGHGMALSDGTLYVVGGQGGPYYNNITATSLQSIDRVGRYSKLISLGSVANVTGITFTGTIANGNRNVLYRSAGSDGIFGAMNRAVDISGAGGCTGNLTNTQYVWVFVSLDDAAAESNAGYYPDSTGPTANMTELAVNYNTTHPAPNIRLRGGQTLQNGSLSPLDTCRP